MKKLFYIILSFIIISCNENKKLSIKSPDEKINLRFELINGVPYYSIKKNNLDIINNSRMGILFLDGTDLSENLTIISTNNKSFNEDWYPLYGEEKKINNHYNELEISLKNQKNEFHIIFRALSAYIKDKMLYRM